MFTLPKMQQIVNPLLFEFQENYPTIDIYLRGDSGFADVLLYEKLESNGVSYAIRLKESRLLRDASADYFTELCELIRDNQVDYVVVYGEFFYKADSWLYPRRVAVKVEKPYGQLTYLYTFIVTNMESKLRKSLVYIGF